MNRSNRSSRVAAEPGEARRRLLRLLYTPYCWLVVVPWFLSSTIVLGIIAVLISLVSPRLAFHCGTFWAWCACRINWTWVTVRGRRHAEPGKSYILMSNHQSQWDILSFYGHWGRQFRWVMKEELRKVPGIGWYCSAGGHIFIDRSNRERAIASLKAARPLLDGGISVMFFPEGTRSEDGRMGAFKKGGFMMAKDMDLPILPISISNSRYVLPNNAFRSLPGHIRITLHEPIDVSKYSVEDIEQLMDDVRESIDSGLSSWEQGRE